MDRPDWAPDGTDLGTPGAARGYDCQISHTFAVDRGDTYKIMAVPPDARLVAQANRALTHRSVRLMVNPGIRQFLAERPA
jgi:hypothetical protein